MEGEGDPYTWIWLSCWIQQVSLFHSGNSQKQSIRAQISVFVSSSCLNFDIGMATTTGNQMQCRQSCSWQLLICFEQTNISSLPICFLTFSWNKKEQANVSSSSLQLLLSCCVTFSFSCNFCFFLIYVSLSFTLLLFCLLLALVAQVVLDVIFPSWTACQIFLRGM